MNPIIKKDRVVPAGTEPTASKRRRAHARVARLLSVEGDVRAIEFQCSCGEISVIELEYADGELTSSEDGEKEPRA